MKYIQTESLKNYRIKKFIFFAAAGLFIFLIMLLGIAKLLKPIQEKENSTQKREIAINKDINIIIEKSLKKEDGIKQGEHKKEEMVLDGKNYLKYTYVIQKGDTLWKIAKKFLNDAYAWPDIQKYNETIKDPHWIEVDDQIIIYIPKKE